jgi:hypothetical protein
MKLLSNQSFSSQLYALNFMRLNFCVCLVLCLVLSCLVSCLVLSLVLSCLVFCRVRVFGLCLALSWYWYGLVLISRLVLSFFHTLSSTGKAREQRTPTFGLCLGFLGFIWRCVVFEIPYDYDAHEAQVTMLCCASCAFLPCLDLSGDCPALYVVQPSKAAR